MKIEIDSQFKFVSIKNHTFEQHLKQNRFSFTTERGIILNAVLSYRGHFRIEDIYEKCKKGKKRISYATLYRTVPLLEEAGIIRSLDLKAPNKFFEHTFKKNHHEHLLCIQCGKIIEYECDEIEKLQESICKKYAFKMKEHFLEIRGYCNKCHTNRSLV